VLKEYGYTVLVSSRGTDALEIAGNLSDSIQLMVTDVVMPGRLNGKQLADRMAASRPEMKVLFISGYADRSLFSPTERNGQIHLLEKPFSPSVLVQKVRELLDGE